jgi:hypothetical protein
MLSEATIGAKEIRDSGLSRYEIPDHVHVCVTAEGSVLLDLRQDKYFGLGRGETEILAAAVIEWPRPSWKCGPHPERESNDLCSSMLELGLLARSRENVALSRGQRRRGKALPNDMRGEWISIGDELEVRSPVSTWHSANFISAYLWARWSLAWRPIIVTVEKVRARKAKCKDDARPLSVLELSAIVDVFRRLRPFVFAAEGHCLLHALTLVRFLSKYAFYPDWVIGVTTQPWGAHSWVQWGDFLLDTNPEKVCAYTPILII